MKIFYKVLMFSVVIHVRMIRWRWRYVVYMRHVSYFSFSVKFLDLFVF